MKRIKSVIKWFICLHLVIIALALLPVTLIAFVVYLFGKLILEAKKVIAKLDIFLEKSSAPNLNALWVDKYRR